MTLLDAVEKLVGNEYFVEDNYSEFLLSKLPVDHNVNCDNQSQQPNANKIALINY
jgi:hypothetical protein